MAASAIIILCLFAFGAAFIQRTTGCGFGIFIMTALPYLMPSYGEATTLSGMLAGVTSFIIAVRYRKHVVWRRLWPILVTFIIVSFFAIQLLTVLRSDVLKSVLGVVLILAAVYFLFVSNKIKVSTNLPTQGLLGTMSGFMGGLFSMQGPPAAVYFLGVSRTKEEFAGIAQTYFFIGNLAMTIYRAHIGFVTTNVLTSWGLGIPAVLLGTTVGAAVFNRLPMPVIRKLVYIYIGLSGILALTT